MAAARLLVGIAILTTLSCVAAASQNPVTDIDKGRKGDKKTDDMVNDMYTAFMMTKNVMSMMLMFVSPIMQIKGFGLSVLNTLINVGRFLLQMQSTKRLQEMATMYRVSSMSHPEHHADHHVLMTHHDPVSHHIDHEHTHHPHRPHHPHHPHDPHDPHDPHHPHGDHDSPVYIISDHEHNSWDDSHHDHAVTTEHDITWNHPDPDDHWKITDHSFSAPNHDDESWSSSQKFAYYAHPPATLISNRLGLMPPPSTSPPPTQQSLPPAHASYVSGDNVRQIYPYFTHNLTRFK